MKYSAIFFVIVVSVLSKTYAHLSEGNCITSPIIPDFQLANVNKI